MSGSERTSYRAECQCRAELSGLCGPPSSRFKSKVAQNVRVQSCILGERGRTPGLARCDVIGVFVRHRSQQWMCVVVAVSGLVIACWTQGSRVQSGPGGGAMDFYGH
jgi:hypothetical protein